MQKIIAYLLLVLVGLTGCTQTPTAQAPKTLASDELTMNPGGSIDYSNLPGSWPPIVEMHTTLNYGDHYVAIAYWENIETLAGQTRNDIFRTIYYKGITIGIKAVGLPNGITWEDRDGSSGQRIISFNISSDVQPGQYDFKVDVMIDGDDFGTLPCTIKVVR